MGPFTMPFLVHAIGHVQINVSDPAAVIKDATGILGLHVHAGDSGPDVAQFERSRGGAGPSALQRTTPPTRSVSRR